MGDSFLNNWVTIHSIEEYEEIEEKTKRELQKEFIEELPPDVLKKLREKQSPVPEGFTADDFFAWPGVYYDKFSVMMEDYVFPVRVYFMPNYDWHYDETGYVYTELSLSEVVEPDAKFVDSP